MRRRKVLAGVGSLAAGSAAAMSTGAFTSVSADRVVRAKVSDDTKALLTMYPEDTYNGQKYTRTVDTVDDGSATVLEFDFSQAYSSAEGFNDEATTIIRDVFGVQNQGYRPVYVWAQGLPEGMRMFTDDTSYLNRGTGAGNNQGAFSDTSNLNVPSDPADVNDSQNPGGYEAAPKLGVGDSAGNIGVIVDSALNDDIGDTTIQIVAKAASTVE